MANNNLGELRRSSIISTFGPGAIVDYRVGDAPVSAVTAGLEEWDRRSPPSGILNPQTVFEPRLQRRLGVAGFRLPPVNVDDDEERPALIGVRFPEWLQCPSCHVLKSASKWVKEPGDPKRSCGACTANAPGGHRVFVVPVRFVCACENGHLDEFPWHFWVQHKLGCNTRGPLKLQSEAAGLAGLTLSCGGCKSRRSMEGVFSKKALLGITCSGRRPWLAAPSEQGCDRSPPRTLQRGASNLYFPVTLSALDIPPWSDNIQKQLGQFWDPIMKVPAQQRAFLISTLMPVLGDIGLAADDLAHLVNERIAMLEDSQAGNLRWDEYLQFTSGKASVPVQEVEFEIRPEMVPGSVRPYLGHLVRAVRLREVRALSGFTRIQAPPTTGDQLPPVQARLSVGTLNWLPAIEVRGEGIFLDLERGRLNNWETLPAVVQRAARLHEAYLSDWQERHGHDSVPDRVITGRFLLVHSLAHVLMRQLALTCGYSSASLRERLYVGANTTDMCGLLIYTATTDADGTLGGLARQGRGPRLESTLVEAIRAAEWCSSDPLCIHEMVSAPDSFNLASCHSCVLAPETSCEEYNRFMDRAMLVGTPEHPELGFFRDLLRA